jgi:hypothetical protein
MFEGHVTTGGFSSETLMVKKHVLMLPALSVAVQNMTVDPNGNRPLVSLQLDDFIPEPSVGANVQEYDAVGTPPDGAKFTLDGQLSVGGVSSILTTLNEHVLVRAA